MPHPVPIPPRVLTRENNNMLDTHEPHDLRRHVDGDDMTYQPVKLTAVNDNRTGTQRLDELAAAIVRLAHQVTALERRLEAMQGD